MHVYVGLCSRYVDSIGVLPCQCLWTMVSPVLSDSGVLILIIILKTYILEIAKCRIEKKMNYCPALFMKNKSNFKFFEFDIHSRILKFEVLMHA